MFGLENEVELMRELCSEPYFTVVIPVYNRSHIISRALDSLSRQSFKDFEVIVVDDGSDDSAQLKLVLEKYTDLNFKYIRQENSGGGVARNRGIDEASGQYIALLDSDDEYLPEKLENCYQRLQSDSSLELIFSSMWVDRGNGKRWRKPEIFPSAGERIDEYLTCTPGWIQTSTIVIRTDKAQKIRFSEYLPSSQDTDFAIRCYLSGLNISFIEAPLVVMADEYDPARVSKQKNEEPLIEWVRLMRKQGMSDKAVRGYLGWQVARVVSHKSIKQALRYYGSAAISGTYKLPVAFRIAMQIVIPESYYQKIMSYIVKILGDKK